MPIWSQNRVKCVLGQLSHSQNSLFNLLDQVRLPQARLQQLLILEPLRQIPNSTKTHHVDRLPMLILPHLENRKSIDWQMMWKPKKKTQKPWKKPYFIARMLPKFNKNRKCNKASLHCYEQEVHFHVDEIKLYIKLKSSLIISNEKYNTPP